MYCNSIAFYIANNFPTVPFYALIDYHLKGCIEGLDSKITLSGNSFQKRCWSFYTSPQLNVAGEREDLRMEKVKKEEKFLTLLFIFDTHFVIKIGMCF
jgi:hypothetical protein